MSERKNYFQWNFWTILVILFAVVATFRLLLFNRFALLLVLSIAATGGLLYFLWQRWSAFRKRKAYLASTAGKLSIRIADFEKQIDQLQQEIRDIQSSIEELKSSILQQEGISERSREQTRTVLRSFEKERDLRLEKIRFYQTCIHKLEKLRTNHQLTQSLSQKTRLLKKLQEKHYDDLAEMEAIRTELNYEENLLLSMDELSLRLLNTESVSETQGLQEELEKMTREV